jgi:DNA polymerase elongation subunit (family B)
MTTKRTIGKSFRLFDYHVFDKQIEEDESQKLFTIQIFGINEKGETVSMYITDFKPFFYVKIPDHWSSPNIISFVQELRQKIYGLHSSMTYRQVNYNKLYGFSNDKQEQFIELTFDNLALFNRVKSLWYSYESNDSDIREKKLKPYIFKEDTLDIYESNIPPLLRYFHIKQISPSGWVRISINKCMIPPVKTTSCTYEYIGSQSHIQALPEKETRVPYKICSYDIEASSSHGDFPIPIKTYKRLATNMIDIFEKQLKMGEFNHTQMSSLFQRMILTAFQYDSFQGIDTIYPKQMPTKQEIVQKIKVLLEKPLKSFSYMDESEIEHSLYKVKEILSIDSIFEKIKKNNEIDHSDSDSDKEEKPITKNKKQAIVKQTIVKPHEHNIIHFLMDTNQSRDIKVQKLNELMTLLFPRVEGDKVTFIGSTFMKYGDTEPYLNHCIVLNTCEPVNGAVIETMETERELLIRWAELIQEENPDIIIGYNIFQFDYEFLFRRSQETNCTEEFLKLSRNMDHICGKRNRDGDIDSIENNKIVLASGEYDLRYINMIGRIQIDMYTYFRRDFNLSSYKLDDVSGEFISDSISKIEYDESENHTKLSSKNLIGLKTGDFIHIEISGFTSNYYKHGHKFRVLHIQDSCIFIEGNYSDLSTYSSIKWCMAKDDVSPQDIFRLSGGSSYDRSIVAKYCIQDCNLVHYLLNKIDVITGYIEMSNICSVPINYLIFRGQGIKLTSYVAKKCREKNTLMPDLDKSSENDGYEGAIVLPPKCGMYMDNPVACVDYSSLYPSSMISQNYSHDSKVWTKEYDLQGNLIHETGHKDANGLYVYDNIPGYKYIDIEFDTFKYTRKTPKSAAKKIKSGTKICRWAQNKKGIMPSILEELLKARSDTRKMTKTEKDPFMKNILDKRQLGYKVTANSLYGQCGAKTSTFYEKDVAASTTATGRMMIIYAKRIIEEVYGDSTYDTQKFGTVMTKAEYVYGDSVAGYTPLCIRRNGDTIVYMTIEELSEIDGRNHWQPCLEEGKYDKEVCPLHGIESWSEHGWTPVYRIIRHRLAAHKKIIRIITNTGLVDITDDHSLLLPNGHEISPKNVDVGDSLMHTELPVVIKPYMPNREFQSIFFNNQLDAAKYAYTLKSYEESYHVECINGKYGIVVDYPSSEHTITIREKIELPSQPQTQPQYVYDLTTENHHFMAGIGNIVVHNTDSVFFTFHLEDPITHKKIVGKDALEITIEIAQHAAKLCSEWLKPPMELSYEKTLMPFILLSKKRYVGQLYEDNPNDGYLKFMGLALKRRDSCDYLKDVYGEILNILMNTNDITEAVRFLENALTKLIEKQVPMDKLAITKALKSYYKIPQQIAHYVLSERIGNRDPGNKPKAGDRIKYLYVVNDNKDALLGEKIETPEFIMSNKIQIDYTYYITNQLMKPLTQLFGLAVVQLWQMNNKGGLVRTYEKDMIKMEKEYGDDLETWMKKKEKYCSEKVKTILFDKFLEKIHNEKHGIQRIDNCFMKMGRILGNTKHGI